MPFAFRRRARAASAMKRNTRSISAESCGDARLMGRPPRAAADCQKKTARRHCAMFMALPPITPHFLTGRHDLRPAFSARPASVRPRECLSRFGGGRALHRQRSGTRAAKGVPSRTAPHSLPGRFSSARAGGVLALGRRARGQGAPFHEEVVRDVVLQFFFAKSRYF